MRYLKLWLLYTALSFQQTLYNRFIVVLFFVGKLIRIVLFLIFLYFIMQKTGGIGTYTKEQVVFFFLVFNLLDTLSQFFFREVYRFRPLIVTGSFDLILTKPVHPLSKVLMGGADIMDLMMLVILGTVVGIYGWMNISQSPSEWVLFIIMVSVSMLLATAFHVAVLAFGILTTVVDNIIMVYRDVTSIFRIPLDVYAPSIRFFFTFIIPLGIMLTVPAKTLMGHVNIWIVLVCAGASYIVLKISLMVWNRSLQEYQSASS